MKNNFIKALILLVLGLCLGIGAAYAYLAVRISGTETSSTIALGAGTMSITYANNSSSLVLSKIIPGAEVTKKFTLTGKNDTTTNSNSTDNNMYYKIGIVVDNNTFSEGALRYKLVKDSSSTNNGQIANNLTGVVQKSGTRYIASGYFAKTTSANHVYNLTISFPETGTDQSADQGASFACHITIAQDRQTYDYSKTGVEFITNLYNSEDASVNGLEQDPTSDKNIRYVGSSPRNYVEFGNTGELWRIIGIFNVKDSSGNTSKKLKIVRNDSLGSYSWDATGNNDYGFNDWTDADLMKELNGDYLDTTLTANKTNWYNSYWDSNTSKPVFRQTGVFNYTKTIKSEYQAMISEAVWNIGGNVYTTVNSAATLPTLDQYNKERGTQVYSGRPTTWTGKIGLIYPSDFGYASTDTECRKDLKAGQVYSNGTYDYTNVNCKNNNWLHKGSWYWTLSPFSGNSRSVFYVRGEGIVGSNHACGSYGVFGATYLMSDIHIISGTGTSTNPYKLG